MNGDSIRLALTGDRFNALAENQVCAIKHTMIRALLLQGYEVMVDGTHTSVSSIIRLLEIDINAQFHFVSTSINLCIEHAIESKQEDLISVIRRHDKNLHVLTNSSSSIKILDLEEVIDSIRDDIIERNEHTTRV